MENVMPILETVAQLIGAAVALFLIPWLRAKAGEQNVQRLAHLARIAVQAAEQMHPKTATGHGRGEEKKRYALHVLTDSFPNMRAEQIEAAVEAACFATCKSDKNGV